MKKLCTVLALLPLAAAVDAATDGVLGATSSGDVDVTLAVGDLVKVSFPAGDLAVPYVDDSIDETLTEEFCVYSNQASVDIDLTVAPQNAPTVAGAPVLADGGSEIPYTLALKLADGSTISAAADDIDETGITLASHAEANNVADDCATGGNSHEFVVTVAELDVEAAPAGSYSDTIQVDVAPN